MTGLVKGIIISVVVVVIIGIIAIGAGVYWISSHSGEFLEKSKQTIAEGEKFGRDTDNQGCVTETISRHRQNPGLSGAISTQLFLTSCLRSSRETPGFCDDVPKRTEFMKSAEWQAQQCAREGLRGDTYCPQIFSQVQTFCDTHRPSQ